MQRNGGSGFDSKDYLDFRNRLEKIGYFRGEVQGSELFNTLEKQAREQYLQTTNSREYLLDELNRLMSSDLVDLDLLPRGKNDSDDWLEMKPKDIDELMAENHNLDLDDESDIVFSTNKSSLDEQDRAKLEELNGFVGGFSNLFSKESGVGGALVPGELSEEDSSDEDYQPVSFDADLYLDELSKGLGDDMTPKASNDMHELMESMDEEIRQNNIGTDFYENEDANLLKNMLESFTAQQGLSGPASSLIQSIGLKLPTGNL